jgi:hypothetical protein
MRTSTEEGDGMDRGTRCVNRPPGNPEGAKIVLFYNRGMKKVKTQGGNETPASVIG